MFFISAWIVLHSPQTCHCHSFFRRNHPFSTTQTTRINARARRDQHRVNGDIGALFITSSPCDNGRRKVPSLPAPLSPPESYLVFSSSKLFLSLIPKQDSENNSTLQKLSPEIVSSTTNSPFQHEVISNCPALGGDIIRIRSGPDDDGFLNALGVPSFAVLPSNDDVILGTDAARVTNALDAHNTISGEKSTTNLKRLGLEAIIKNANAFLISDAIPKQKCEEIIKLVEHDLKFGNFNAGKNNLGAMQIVVPSNIADDLLALIGPNVDLSAVVQSSEELSDECAFDDLKSDVSINGNTEMNNEKKNEKFSYSIAGINRRFRIYRYAPDQKEQFAPHIDAGFPPGGVSFDDDDSDSNNANNNDDGNQPPTLLWDASHHYSVTTEIVSRLTVLIYLNDDFSGGHTKFYSPLSENDRAKKWDIKSCRDSDVCSDDSDNKNYDDYQNKVIASIQPRAGSILVFPQAVSESSVERARYLWPQHEGSPVTSGNRSKYIIRTDVLFETSINIDDVDDNVDDDKTDEKLSEREKLLFQHDHAVRQALLPTSSLFSSLFLQHVQPLYNPHMGVENVGPLLYSLVRFTKCRKIVEVGAGYTTIWLLQALKDNEEEMERVVKLEEEGRLRLLDYPFGTPKISDWDHLNDAIKSASPSLSSPHNNGDASSSSSSSLLCIDNCLHQRQTASSAIRVAHNLGLDKYLQFLQGDAFDALSTHFPSNQNAYSNSSDDIDVNNTTQTQNDIENIDLLWCDFGVGSRMTEYISATWKFLRPGGFLLCHSTLTNTRTREWLEDVRSRKKEDITGIPAGECAEVSLLEPHKRFQNSVTILQKRVGNTGRKFEEPVYSEYA